MGTMSQHAMTPVGAAPGCPATEHVFRDPATYSAAVAQAPLYPALSHIT